MIFTARQIEELHKSNGHVTLPYRARLTPLAQDWLRAKKVVVGYSDVQIGGNGASIASVPATSAALPTTGDLRPPASGGTLLWWCDGPCGPAKAALMSVAKEADLRALEQPADAKRVVSVIKHIAEEIKANRASGAIVMVTHGALATVFANRCPSIRAILGTCLEAVDQGVAQLSANVLIIEHPYKTMQQVRNMLSRFSRNRPALSDDVKQQLQELATCG